MRTQKVGQAIVFRALFIDTKEGATGLTVTASSRGPSGAIDNAQATTEVDATNQPGVYQYTVAAEDVTAEGLYTVAFHTATTSVDQQDISDSVYVADWPTDIDDIDTNLDQLGAIQSAGDEIDFVPLGAHTSTALGAGVVTPTVPLRANAVMLQSGVEATRYTLNGTTPSASVGFVLAADAVPIVIPLKRGTVLKYIRAASGAVLEQQFGRLKREL